MVTVSVHTMGSGSVGAGDGDIVGMSVGSPVGNRVGSVVGSCVGSNVCAIATSEDKH